MNNRVLVGGLIGGVVFFFLGYLLYGLAFGTMLAENQMAGINRPMEEFQWAFLVLGNLFMGVLIAYLLNKSNTSGFGPGATFGAIFGLLFALAFNFTMYGTTNYFSTMTGLFLDMLVVVIMFAIAGGIVGVFMGRGKTVVRV